MCPPCRIPTIPCGLLLCLVSLAEFAQGGAITALYVLGDSQADVGNNNYLVTPGRANFPHNGVDYPGHVATGRFSNGYNFVDFLAAGLGVASPPAYLSIVFNATGRSSTFLKGVNFASGGAGVLDLTNKGVCISFDDQIERDYYSVYTALTQLLGRAQASTHIAESMFAVAIGGNDIIDRVLLNPTGPLNVSSGADFVRLMAQSLKRQLQRMYDLGMRRLLFVGAAPLGCIPLMRQRSLDGDNGCNAEANSLAVEYNAAAASVLRGMSSRHSDFRYSFFNTSTALLLYIQELEANGSDEVRAACCGLGFGDDNAMFGCTPASSLCPNRTNHVFWDFVHPTEITAEKLTRIAFEGSKPLVSPVNLTQLCTP